MREILGISLCDPLVSAWSAIGRKGRVMLFLAVVAPIAFHFLSLHPQPHGPGWQEFPIATMGTAPKAPAGNIAWGSFHKGGDVGQDMLESLMSLTGTVVVNTPTVTADGKTQAAFVPTIIEPTLDYKTLLNGSKKPQVNILRCDTTTSCLNPTPTAVTGFEDMTTRVTNILLGTGGSDGLVYKFANPSLNLPLTAQEEAFTETAPGPIMMMVRGIAQMGSSAAKMFANWAAPYVARELTAEYVDRLLGVVKQESSGAGANTHETAMLAAYMDQLGKVDREVYSKAQSLAAENKLTPFILMLIRPARPARPVRS